MSRYDKIVSYFEENKDQDWKKWLSFNTIFDKPGKQGIVGLFSCKEKDSGSSESDISKDDVIIFKISQYINYLVNHELVIMQGLSEISTYCPNFLKGYGKIKCKIEPNSYKSSNPFGESKFSVEKDVLLCEYINKSCKFYNYIRSKHVDENILYSIVKQVLMGICIAQKEKRFTHYDLHSFNIMIKKCDKNLSFLYVIDEENQFLIPSLGYYPIIIDYGFSYIENMDNNPLWTSLAHTNVGFMSDRFDPIADPKLFLVTVAYEIKSKKHSRKSRTFKTLVKKLFKPLDIDFECGWDNTQDDMGAVDYVCDIISNYNTTSRIFDDYDYYCIDIIQSLIILPLQEQNYDNISDSFTTFLKEFVKIENEISNSFYNLYILKEIVDAARYIRYDYVNKETRNKAILHFKNSIYLSINKITKFCNPKDINFERMLCSLLLFAKNIEGILYNIIENRMSEKYKEYNKLEFDSIEEVYGIIEDAIPDEYVFTSESKIMIIDNINRKNKLIDLNPVQINNINELDNLSKGCYVFDMVYKTPSSANVSPEKK